MKIVVAAMIWEISGFESDKFSTCVFFDIFKMDLFIYILEFGRKIAYENHETLHVRIIFQLTF